MSLGLRVEEFRARVWGVSSFRVLGLELHLGVQGFCAG